MNNLSEAQQRVYKTIKNFIDEYGYSPTVREIGKVLSKTPGTINFEIKMLKRKGYLDYTPLKSRTIRILKNVK